MFSAMPLKAQLTPEPGIMLISLHGKPSPLLPNTFQKYLAAPDDIAAREKMAWADTLAGLCIANAGVTLPHGMGMAIGGMYPNVAHGEALAIVYPAFTRFTWESAVPQFAKLARTLNPGLKDLTDGQAAGKSVEEVDKFLKKIGLWVCLKDKGMPENEINLLANQCMVLPDYKGNPRVATEEEMIELVRLSYNNF